MKYLFKNICIITVLLMSTSYCNAEAVTDEINIVVNEFVGLLAKDYSPTLNDYQKYYGYSDTEELKFQWKACESEGWTPPLRSSDCNKETVIAWSTKQTSPSLFLGWLKKQLPVNPKVTIQSRDRVVLQGKIQGTRISALLNDVPVVFWLPNKKNNAPEVGLLSIIEISRIPVAKLYEQESYNSVLLALGLKTLVRPLTEKEIASRRQKIDERCAADPDCVKRRKEQKRHHEEERKEQTLRKKLASSYQAWCDSNKAVCKKQKNEREKIVSALKNLENKCDDNYVSCVADAKEYIADLKELQSIYCNDRPSDCAQLNDLRKQRMEKSADFCEKNPKLCKESSYDRAVKEARSSLDK